MSICFDGLAKISKLESRSISAENPKGAKGKGGMSASNLGVGRKGHAHLPLNAGDSHTIAEIEGPGCIRHIWLATSLNPKIIRGTVIRIFWDDLPFPSVECPIGDFFGVAHGRMAPYASILTAEVEGRGFNTWIPMPFNKARIEVINESDADSMLTFQVDYTLGDEPDNTGRLCCTFRRENPTTIGKDFAILEKVKGEGSFLGCVVGVRTLSLEWWGEGEIKIYMDGDEEFPTICGTGAEDYYLTAYDGVGPHGTLYQGSPLRFQDFISFYRWHVLDPIYFHQDIRITMQQIGATYEEGYYERSDDW